jgi:hypothetical protein
MEDLIDRMVEYLKVHRQFDMVDQSELEGGFTWEEANAIDDKIIKEGKMLSDIKTWDGWEETTWLYEYKGMTLRLVTIFGIGAFSYLVLV